MSPFSKYYLPKDDEGAVKCSDNTTTESPIRSPVVVKPREDPRPIHRLRKNGSKKVRQGFVQRPTMNTTTRKDTEKVEFRDGFLTCAALLQSFVRTHPRMGNRLKDELLISIHQYNQLLLNSLGAAHHNEQQRQAQPAQQPIKQEKVTAEVREGHCRDSVSPDRMSESSHQSVTSDMTSSESLAEEECNVGSPLYLQRFEVLGGGEVDSITCRHCHEKDLKDVTCRYQCGQEGCCQGDGEVGMVCDQPQSEPQDLRTTSRGSSSTTETGDMWRPW